MEHLFYKSSLALARKFSVCQEVPENDANCDYVEAIGFGAFLLLVIFLGICFLALKKRS